MERSIALDSHRSSALPVVSASKAKSIPLAGLSSVNELVAALYTTILTGHQPVPAPLHDDSAVKRALMSPLAESVIGTSDPGTGTQVVELVLEKSVPATLLICVCVVPWDGVRTAA